MSQPSPPTYTTNSTIVLATIFRDQLMDHSHLEKTLRRRHLRHLLAQEKLKVSVRRQHNCPRQSTIPSERVFQHRLVSLEQNKKETNMERDQATRRVSWKTSLLALVALSSHPLESQMTCYQFFAPPHHFHRVRHWLIWRS